MLALKTRRRLHSSAPHLSVGVTACLVGTGGGDGTCRWKGVMNQEDMDWGLGRWWWGARLVLIPCHCARVASTRSTLVRAAIPCWGSTVANFNQSRNGDTRYVIPMASYFACIMCHAVSGANKGETINRRNRDRGARDARGMETLSGLGVSGGR